MAPLSRTHLVDTSPDGGVVTARALEHPSLAKDVGVLLFVAAIGAALLLTFGVCYAAFHSTAPGLFGSFPGSAETEPATPP